MGRHPKHPQMPAAAWGVLGVLAHHAGMARAEAESAAFSAGCLIHGYAFTGELPPSPEEPIENVISISACQILCMNTTGCRAFSYWAIDNECRLYSSSEAALTRDANAVSGPEYCSHFRDVCTTAEPTMQWPSQSPGVAGSEAWPRGFQPTRFQCFGKDETGTAVPCNERQVIQSSDLGWPGRCEDFAAASCPANTSCEACCTQNADCAVYAELDTGECLVAPVGRNCHTGSVQPLHAKRYARSQARHIETNVNLTGMQVMDLELVFDAANMGAASNPSEECRDVCASVYGCSLWQLSSVGGCYVEVPSAGKEAVYPLEVGAGLLLNGEFASAFIAGGFMEQVCSEALPPPETLSGNVKAVCTFPEMDFNVLASNESLMTETKLAISAGIAAIAGQPYSAADVFTELSAGSVVADSILVVPSDASVDREVVAKRLESGLVNDPFQLLTRVQAVPGIRDACNGNLPSSYAVSSVVVTQEAPPPATTAAPAESDDGFWKWLETLGWEVALLLVLLCCIGAAIAAVWFGSRKAQRKNRLKCKAGAPDEFDAFDPNQTGKLARDDFITSYVEEQARLRSETETFAANQDGLSETSNAVSYTSNAPLVQRQVPPSFYSHGLAPGPSYNLGGPAGYPHLHAAAPQAGIPLPPSFSSMPPQAYLPLGGSTPGVPEFIPQAPSYGPGQSGSMRY